MLFEMMFCEKPIFAILFLLMRYLNGKKLTILNFYLLNP
jgi:hypothetical protein